MNLRSATLLIPILLSLGGCASVTYGDKQAEARLRQLQAVPGKTSLYVCREAAVFSAAGNRTTVFVDKQPIGTLKPGNFAHTVVEPGSHDLYVKRNPGGDSGVLTVPSQAGEVTIIWVGVTGAGFGALTVDFFSTRREAEQCVKDAEYAIWASS